MKHNEKKLEEYLQLQPVSLIRQCLWVWLIFFLAVSLPTTLTGVGKEYTRIIFSPIIIIMCIWNIWLLVKTEKKQKAYLLFVGVYSLIFSFLLLLASIKFAYTVDRFPVVFFIVVSVLFYIIDFFLFHFYIKSWLSKVSQRKKKKLTKNGNPTMFLNIAAIISVLIMIISKVTYVPHRTQMILLIFDLLLLCYIFELGSNCLYKYYLIRKMENSQTLKNSNNRKI